jgi:hypothetical protein
MKLTICKASVFVYVALFYAMLMAGCQTSQIVTADYIAHEKVSYSQSSYQENTNVVQVKGGDTADLLNEYKVTMQGIGEVIAKLRQEKLRTFSAIELVISGNSQGGYTNATKIIKERVALQSRLIEEIDYAEEKFAVIAKTYPVEWNRQIKMVANDLDEELDIALDDLNNETDKFSELFDTDKLEIFDYMAKDKTELLAAIRKQHIEIDPDIPLFKQLKASVRLGKNVDKTQLVFLEYAVCVLNLQGERLEIEKTMGELDMVNYLGILHDQRMDAGNISTVLDFTFAESVASSIPPLPVHDSGVFKIRIRPDKGKGGIYYEGEKITFIIEASKDCYYILRSIDSEGKITQLCPNEYYKDHNFIRANVPVEIPADFMGFSFDATAPYGVDKVEVIASRNRIKYNPVIDKMDMVRYRAPSEKTEDVLTRGIKVNKRHKALLTGGSYDEQSYDTGDDGNAVIIRTFVRIMPRQI